MYAAEKKVGVIRKGRGPKITLLGEGLAVFA
jgi:hypothetical protein